MKELNFNEGRLSFSLDTYEMVSCLPDTVETRIRLFYLDENGLMEGPFIDFDYFKSMQAEKSFVWLHLSGNISTEFWKELAQSLDYSDEQIQYLRSPHKRSLFEDFPNALFWTLQRPSVTESINALETVNFLMSDKVLVTRQFSHDYAFSAVSHYLLSKGDLLKDLKVDGLAANLVQDVIDSYVQLLVVGGTRLETIQNKIIRHPGKEELNLINRAQQVIWIFLNAVWPIETVILAMVRSKNPILTDEGRQELNYRLSELDSVVRLFETYRAMSYNLMDVYVSGLSLRTNETTTVLTMIATLFLPPTLIAGIYGMNFYIPEIHVSFGYYACLASMIVVSGGLLIWIKSKGFV